MRCNLSDTQRDLVLVLSGFVLPARVLDRLAATVADVDLATCKPAFVDPAGSAGKSPRKQPSRRGSCASGPPAGSTGPGVSRGGRT